MNPNTNSSSWRPVGPNRLLTNGSSKEGAAQTLYRFAVCRSLRRCGEYIISFTERVTAWLRAVAGGDTASEASVIAEPRVSDGLGMLPFRGRSKGRVRGRHNEVGNVSLVGLPEVPLVVVSAVFNLVLYPESVDISNADRDKLGCSPL